MCHNESPCEERNGCSYYLTPWRLTKCRVIYQGGFVHALKFDQRILYIQIYRDINTMADKIIVPMHAVYISSYVIKKMNPRKEALSF